MRVVATAILALTASAVCADDFHHYSGMAVVTTERARFAAAFTWEDFDPNHTPELGLEGLYRLTLAPLDPRVIDAVLPSRVNALCDMHGHLTESGHTVLKFDNWTIELVPAVQAIRKHLQGNTAGSSPRPHWIILTPRGPQNGDGDHSDEIVIVGREARAP